MSDFDFMFAEEEAVKHPLQPLQPKREPEIPEPPEGPFDFMFAKEPVIEPAAILQAEKSTPAQTAKSNKLASQTNLPPDVVDRNTDLVEKKVKANNLRIAMDEPAMQEFASRNPRNLSLVSDDIEHLTGLPRWWRKLWTTGAEVGFTIGEGIETVTAAVSTATHNVEDALGITAAFDWMFGEESAARHKEWLARNKGKGLTTAVLDLAEAIVTVATTEGVASQPWHDLSPEKKEGKAWREFDRGDLPKIPSGTTVDQLLDDPMEHYLPFLAHTMATSLPETAVNLASLPLGVVASAGRLANDRAEADGRKHANLADLIVVLPASLAVVFLDRIGGRAFLGMGDDALKIIGKATSKAIAKAGTKAVGKAFVKETVTEAIQEGIESVAGSAFTKRGFDPQEAGKAMIGGAVGGGPMGGGFRTATASVEAVVIHSKAKARTKAIREMNDAGSDLRELDPAAYAEYQSIAMEQAGIEEVTVTPEAARVLNQTYDAGIDEEVIIEAESAGSTVSMTAQDFWVLPVEAVNEVAPSVSFHSGTMSEEEAKEAADLASKAAVPVEDREILQTTEREAQEARISQRIQERLIEVGGAMSDPADARAGAEQMAAAITTMATREGIDPEILAMQWVPTITKGQDVVADAQVFTQTIKDNQAKLAEAATKRQNREITEEQYLDIIAELKPVTPYKQEDLPVPATKKAMRSALKEGQKGRIGKGIEWVGKLVGLRLDIPAYEFHDTWVPTIHDQSGKPVAHESVAHITGDITFTQPGDKAEEKAGKVGRGETPKAPFAQINGTLKTVHPSTVRKKMNEIFNDPEWVQVGYDPRRHTFFYNRDTQQPIVGATEVMQVGPLVMAKNPVYGDSEAFLFQGADPSEAEHSLSSAQKLLKDEIDALGLTEEQASRVNPIYRPEVVPTERLESNKEAALWLEERFDGEAITDHTAELTPSQIEEISTLMAAEAQLALESTGSALDWYSGALTRALAVAQIKYPMLKSDASAKQRGFGTASNARFAFTYIMAVTSQNLDVSANTVATDKAFAQMVDRVQNGVHGMERSWGTGDKQEAMGDNFDKFGPMIDAMPGESFPDKLAALDALFRQKKTVGEWIRDMKAAGVPYNAPGQTAMDAVVYGSSALGPKIGNGFWQNLNNNFDPLTIDLWMRRTWGRYVGASIGNPGALPGQRKRLQEAVKRSRSRQQGDQDHIAEAKLHVDFLQWYLEKVQKTPISEFGTKKAFNAEVKRLKAQVKSAQEVVPDLENIKAPEPYKVEYTKDNEALVAYSKRILTVWEKEYARLSEKHKGKVAAHLVPTWARAAKTVITNLAKPLDQVANGTQRKQIEAVGERALEKLSARGIDVTTADLQALLWYPEKDLWGALTKELETDTDNTAIIPNNPLNESYDTTFARILRSQGYDVQGVEGDTTGGADGGAVAGQDVQPQRPEGAEGAGQAGRASTEGAVFDQSENVLLEQQTGATGPLPRGQIDLRDMNNIVIRLFETENLSTFLHESGHLYLEMLGSLAGREGASEQTVADFQTILDWMGAKTAADITTENHEKFAETYEQYLRDGTAPSLKLSEAFAKFTAWLTTLYRKIKESGRLPRADLNPEIAAVFDRMLATEEETSEARRAAAMIPLFNSVEESAMTEQAYETYQRTVRRAAQAGQAELLARTMKDVKRETTKWWKAALKGEITIVKEKLDNDSAWRARYILQHNRMPSGAELDETMPQDIKLSRQSIKDMGFPVGSLPGGNGMVRKEGGVHPDAAAEVLGFESGSELLQSLAALPKTEEGKFQNVDQFAKQEAEQRLKDEHGDVLTDGTIREEALLKVHSEEQARVIVQEMKQVARMSGEGRTPSNVVVKEAARQMLAGKPLTEVMKYQKYLRAEHRASNQAASALAKGDLKAAREAKQRQLLNFHLYRQARTLASKADRQASALKKWKRGKATGVHPDFLAEALLMMEGVNFGKRIGEKRIQKLTIEAFDNWAAQQEKDYGASFHVSGELAAALELDHYLDMTADELAGMHDTVQSVLVQGRRYHKAEAAQFNSMVNSLADSIDANAKTYRHDVIEQTLWQRTKSWGRKGMAEIRRMHSLTRELDGGEDGPIYEAVYLRIKHADDAYIDRSMKGGVALDKILSQYTAAEKLAFYNRTHIPELRQSLSLSSRLAFALNMGNAGNVEAMQNEYTDQQIDAVLSTLTDKDWDVVEAIWAHIDTYWNDTLDANGNVITSGLKSLEERTTGTAPGKVSASPFTTPHGREVTGGYYPLVADPKRSDDGRKDLEARNTLDGMLAGGHAKKTTKHGSTIERSGWPATGRKVWLDLGVAFSHVDGVIKDIEMREAVVEVHRILNHKAFGEAVKNSKGIEFKEIMDTWLSNIVGNDKPRANFLEDVIAYTRNGISIAEMGLSLRTMLQQPAGITMTAAILGERYTVQGLAKFIAYRGKAAREVMELSPFMRNRAATFNRDVRDAQRSLGVKGLHDKVTGTAFWGIQQLDLAVSIPSWIGAHDMEIDRQLKEGEPRNTQKAVDFADGVVSRSQGAGLPRDMAAVQQGPQWKKMFTMFYTFFGAYQNLQTDLWKETSFKSPVQALKYAKNQIYITIIPALVIKALFDGLPDDEDEWPLWAVKSVASFALGGIPGVRDVANSYLSGFDYQMSPIGNVVKQSKKLLEDVAEGEFDDKTLRALLMTTGYLAHFPGARAGDRAVRTIEEGDFDDLDDFEGWWRLLIQGPKK